MKNVLNNTFVILIIIIVLMFSTACFSKEAPKQPVIQEILSYSYYVLTNSEFKDEIVQKEKKLFVDTIHNQDFSKTDHARLLIHLAMLYSHNNNPDPEFGMALQYLKQYALIQDQVSVEYTEALLSKMVDNKSAYGIISDKYDKLIKEKKKIEELYIKLVLEMRAKDKLLQQTKRIIRKNIKEIKKKNEIIERLKALDVELENRRVDTD
ncbi:MAG: hypothetical protein KAJ62_15200 [Desulfobacteraceae bacterium]|nr:hypothetical protein [Desulfobacteraceae bacterium]